MKKNTSKKLSVTVMPWENISIPNGVFISKSAAHFFRSIEVRHIIVPLRKGEEISTKVPQLLKEERERLVYLAGESGIVEVGKRVSYGDILVAKIRIDETQIMEDRVLEKISGYKGVNVSEQMPFWDEGVVVAVKPMESKIIISIAFERELMAGDHLYDKYGNNFIVVGFVEDNKMPPIPFVDSKRVQLIITSTTARIEPTVLTAFQNSFLPSSIDENAISVGKISLEKKGYLCSEKLQMYDMVSVGFKVTPEYMASLFAQGFFENAKDTLLRADHGDRYIQLYELIKGNRKLEGDVGGVQKVISKLEMLLQAMCFSSTSNAGVVSISYCGNEVMGKEPGRKISHQSDFFSPPSETWNYIDFPIPVIHPLFTEDVKKIRENVGVFVDFFYDCEKRAIRGKTVTEIARFMIETLDINPRAILIKLPVLSSRSFVANKVSLFDNYLRLFDRIVTLQGYLEKGGFSSLLEKQYFMVQDTFGFIFKGSKDTQTSSQKGLIHLLAETRKQLYSKYICWGGTGVFIPNVEQSIVECGLPLNFALKVFEAHILRVLPNEEKPLGLVRREIKSSNKKIVSVLEGLIGNLVIFVTSEKQVICICKPKITEGEAIQLHPELMQVLGVQLGKDKKITISVPFLESAQTEAREKLTAARGAIFSLNPVPVDTTFPFNLEQLTSATQEKEGISFTSTDFQKFLLGQK